MMDCRLDDKSDLQFFCVYWRGVNSNSLKCLAHQF